MSIKQSIFCFIWSEEKGSDTHFIQHIFPVKNATNANSQRIFWTYQNSFKYIYINTNVKTVSHILKLKIHHSALVNNNSTLQIVTANLLQQKGRTLDFAMAIGGILEFVVPLLLISHIFYY